MMSLTKFFSKYARGLLLSSLVLAGCAKESGGGGGTVAEPPAGYVDPTVTPGSVDAHPLSSVTTGSTVDFQFDSVATLNTYVQSHPVNDPKNMKMNVQLRKRTFKPKGSTTDVDSYEGRILLGYYDTGNYYIATFESGYGVNGVQNPDDTSTYQRPESQFNRWFNATVGGQNVLVFHGFFQDSYGAIVLVIDGGIDQGDGSGYTSVNGSVYFSNFGVGYATQSPEKCWFISVGPYDCRAFLVSNKINTTSALYPSTTHGYQRLGTFQGLDKIKAFSN